MNDEVHMVDVRFNFWRKWLVICSAITILFSLMMVFGSTGFLFEFYNRQVATAIWGRPELHEAVVKYHAWIFGVLGSSIAGWSVCLLFIALYPFKRREKWAYYCILISILIWAPLDSAFSIYFGVYIEALFNLFAVTLFLIPLIATYGSFFPKEAD